MSYARSESRVPRSITRALHQSAILPYVDRSWSPCMARRPLRHRRVNFLLSGGMRPAHGNPRQGSRCEFGDIAAQT